MDHKDVAKRLLKELRRQKESNLRAAVFDGLAGQVDSTDKVGPAVEKAVMMAAQEIGERFRKGDAGFLVNPRTGKADTASAEGQAKLVACSERDKMVTAGFRCLLAHDFHERLDAETVAHVLQSPDDELVEAALAHIARFKLYAALPAIHRLFRMYPRENRWETGAVLDVRGNNATAQATWMVHFGHPRKQIPRPRVVAAIKKVLKELLDREVEEPADLEALLRDPDVRSRIEGRGR